MDPASEEIAAKLELGSGARARNRGRRRAAAALLLGLAAVAAVALVAAHRSRGPRFRTLPATRGDLQVLVTATGKLEAVNQVNVGSELSGTIERVRVDFNDAVTAGQVLAELDPSQHREKVAQSRASLDAAEAAVLSAAATVHEARLEKRRCQQLARADVCSQQELDRAHAALQRAEAEEASARAQVSLARATLEADRERLEKAVIQAPIDGVVIARYVEPGQTVAATFQTPVLFTLAEDLRHMELHLDIDEADIGQVREGQSASFGVDAHPERRFPAQITSVRYAPRTVDGVVSYEALLRVENPELLLRPGMTATAEIETRVLRDALLVPNAALRFAPPGAREPDTRRGERRVWTLRDGRPLAIPVETGASDGRLTEVRAGALAPGTDLLVDLEESSG